MKTKVFCIVRQSRKTIKKASISTEQATRLLLASYSDNAIPVAAAWAALRGGDTYKFKLDGLGVTLEPLVDHVENY